MAKKLYAQTTKGYNGETLITKTGVEYSAATTLALFLSGPEGAIAVFNATTNVPIGALGVMVDGTSYYVGVLRDGKIAKTQEFVYKLASCRLVAYQAPVKQVSTLTVVGAYVPVLYDEFTIKILDPSATLGNQPIPVYAYTVNAKPAETLDQVMQRLVDSINDPNNVTHKEDDPVVSAVYTAGTDSIALTAIDFGTYFEVAVGGVLVGRTTLAATTPPVLGNGTYEQAAQLEREGWIDEGYGTNYPEIGVPSEWGQPSVFAAVGTTYSFIHVDAIRVKQSVANTVTDRPFHILLIIPSSGTTPLNELQVNFGL
jgi:hypothetical protein